MTRILILGAYGRIARVATRMFLADTRAHLTLYLRQAHRLDDMSQKGRVRVVEGDVLDQTSLRAAVVGQDVVYANLAGDLEKQARCIVKAMVVASVKRLIFVSSMGIYGEVPFHDPTALGRPPSLAWTGRSGATCPARHRLSVLGVSGYPWACRWSIVRPIDESAS